MLGREEEAQTANAEAAEVAHGVAPGSYAKALASLKHFDSAQIGAMEEAVRFLQLSAGASAPQVTGFHAFDQACALEGFIPASRGPKRCGQTSA